MDGPGRPGKLDQRRRAMSLHGLKDPAGNFSEY